MSRTRTVVVQGGGANLYEVVPHGSEFIVRRVEVKLLWNDHYDIGRTRRFEDALSIIRSHSGREIQDISRAGHGSKDIGGRAEPGRVAGTTTAAWSGFSNAAAK